MYRSRFPESNSSVWIIDGWYTDPESLVSQVVSGELNENKFFLPTIGIFVCVWLGLDLFVQVDELGLVWQCEFLQHDGHLPGIGSLATQISRCSIV